MATNHCVPAAAADVCANCGREGGDGTKLKSCRACLLVEYCSVDCQKAHRKQHKRICKKRAAELEDEQLYGQGLERAERDSCPICTLPIPLPVSTNSGIFVCCMKRICDGCSAAAGKAGVSHHCLFCRAPFPDSDAARLAALQKRVAKKDPTATHFLGINYLHGRMEVQKDLRKAVELTEEAAELGSVEALYNLGNWYTEGNGVQVDVTKGIKYLSKAAMQGDAESRYLLGMHEAEKGNRDRAIRHLMISSRLGHEISVDIIRSYTLNGVATKEQYAEALRGYQDAVEETKSHDRDLAKKFQSESG